MNDENLRRGLSLREVEALRQQAWIGDAVLELYARKMVLEQTGERDVARKVSLVRNAFLSHFGQPTRVEAEIGRRFSQEGLDAAFAWIAEHLQPLFLKHEANQRKSQPLRRTKRRR